MNKITDDSSLTKEVLNVSNIFYDTFNEVVSYYTDDCVNMEVWEETCTIALYDTNEEVGLFKQSDIIVVYDLETHLPSIVTERIYKKNYSPREWRLMRNYLKKKLRIIKHELGFNIKVSFTREHIDYVHYKEEWWQWALKQAKSS